MIPFLFLHYELQALNLLNSSSQKIEQKKKAIVCVETRVSVSGISESGYYKGSGFVFNKEKGLIVTNHHVSSGRSVSSIEIIFSNGRRAEAKHVWSHPFVDLSILKLDPKDLKDVDFSTVPLTKTKPQLNEEVEIYSNASGHSFSVHKGQITNLYEDMGFFPVQTIRISVNATFGCSGAPVLNKKGEVIAIVFAGDGTSLFAVPIDYLSSMSTKVGVINSILSYISIDDAIDHYGYPRDEALKYIKKYPDSFNKMLFVFSNYNELDNSAKPGDIILSINGKEVGPSLLKYNEEINRSLQEKTPLTMTVLRHGQKITVQAPIRQAFEPNKYIKFGGALFMESDEVMLITLGIPLKTPVIVKVNQGSLFHIFPSIGGTPQYAIALQSLNNKPIKKLSDIESIARDIIKNKQKYITCVYKDYGVFKGFNQAIIKNQFNKAQVTSAKQEDDFTMYQYTLKTTPNGDQWMMDIVK